MPKAVRVAVVASRFNRDITERLLAGARAELARAGVKARDTGVFWVPGAFEIPVAAARLAGSGRWHAVVTVGCLLQGETSHFDLVASACAHAVAAISLDRDVPVTFGVLACRTRAQAFARSLPSGTNRGAEAAAAALEMAALLPSLDRRPGRHAGRRR